MSRAPLIHAAALSLAGAGAARAQSPAVVLPPGVASSVKVPAGAEMLYVSGIVPPALNPDAPSGTPPRFGDTRTQAAAILERIGAILKAEGYGFGDVVMMRVYLVGDPAKGGRMDFAGMMEAYSQVFGTPAQPHRPARVTVQVAGLAAPGMLAEIEVQAARPMSARAMRALHTHR